MPCLGNLLKLRFMVCNKLFVGSFPNLIGEKSEDKNPTSVITMINQDGANYSFKDSRQDGLLGASSTGLLATPEIKVITKPQGSGSPGQGFRAHQGRP